MSCLISGGQATCTTTRHRLLDRIHYLCLLSTPQWHVNVC